MTDDEFEKIQSVRRHLHFMSGVMLAWDLDSIEIGEEEKDGFWHMLECMKQEVDEILPERCTKGHKITKA